VAPQQKSGPPGLFCGPQRLTVSSRREVNLGYPGYSGDAGVARCKIGTGTPYAVTFYYGGFKRRTTVVSALPADRKPWVGEADLREAPFIAFIKRGGNCAGVNAGRWVSGRHRAGRSPRTPAPSWLLHTAIPPAAGVDCGHAIDSRPLASLFAHPSPHRPRPCSGVPAGFCCNRSCREGLSPFKIEHQEQRNFAERLGQDTRGRKFKSRRPDLTGQKAL
jgi:hypothetical protein